MYLKFKGMDCGLKLFKVPTTVPLYSAHLNFKYLHVEVFSIYISGEIFIVHSSDVHETILLSNIITIIIYGGYCIVLILCKKKRNCF